MDLKKQVFGTLLGLAVGIASTFAFVWRDVAVMKAELSHIKQDISVIQLFIASDDPRAYHAAKNAIREDEERKHEDKDKE